MKEYKWGCDLNGVFVVVVDGWLLLRLICTFLTPSPHPSPPTLPPFTLPLFPHPPTQSELTGPPLKGRKLVYLGDTSDASNLTQHALDCDILIHESTTDDARRVNAAKKGHATWRPKWPSGATPAGLF